MSSRYACEPNHAASPRKMQFETARSTSLIVCNWAAMKDRERKAAAAAAKKAKAAAKKKAQAPAKKSPALKGVVKKGVAKKAK